MKKSDNHCISDGLKKCLKYGDPQRIVILTMTNVLFEKLPCLADHRENMMELENDSILHSNRWRINYCNNTKRFKLEEIKTGQLLTLASDRKIIVKGEL